MTTFIINGWKVYHTAPDCYITTSPWGQIIEGQTLAEVTQQILDWQPA